MSNLGVRRVLNVECVPRRVWCMSNIDSVEAVANNAKIVPIPCYFDMLFQRQLLLNLLTSYKICDFQAFA